MTALALESAKPVIRRSLAESLLACTQFEMDDGEQLAFGTGLHAFIAAYTLLCKEAGEETRFTDVSRLASEAWARTAGLLQSRWTEFMSLCEHFAETHPSELGTLMHIEHTLTHDVGWALLTCTVDRIDRTDFGDPDEAPHSIQISDWKSERGEQDHDFQARWYSAMAFLSFPSLEDVVFAVHALRDWWKPEPMYFHRGELDVWWRATLAGLQARLATPNAAPVGGPACVSCAKRGSCSKAIALARELPDNEAQADELFEEALRMEQAFEVRKDALKKFYADREARVVNGHELGFLTPREPHLVITKSPKEVRTWLTRHHMDGEAAMKVDKEQFGNKAVQEKLVTAGLATLEHGRPAFKWRNFVPARAARAEKKRQSESGEGET